MYHPPPSLSGLGSKEIFSADFDISPKCAPEFVTSLAGLRPCWAARVLRGTLHFAWRPTAAARGDLNLFAILAARTHHYIDADDLVTIRWHRSFADDHIGRGDIHKLVTILDVEVMMFGIVGVKVGFRCVDCDRSFYGWRRWRRTH